MKGLPTQADALMARARRLLHDHQTRARKAGATLDYGLAEVRRLIEASPCCHWCGLPVAFDLQFDHLQPTGRGGQHALHNLTVACSRCNLLRGQLSQAATEELLAMLRSWHPLDREDLERRAIAGGARYAGRRAK